MVHFADLQFIKAIFWYGGTADKRGPGSRETID